MVHCEIRSPSLLEVVSKRRIDKVLSIPPVWLRENFRSDPLSDRAQFAFPFSLESSVDLLLERNDQSVERIKSSCGFIPLFLCEFCISNLLTNLGDLNLERGGEISENVFVSGLGVHSGIALSEIFGSLGKNLRHSGK